MNECFSSPIQLYSSTEPPIRWHRCLYLHIKQPEGKADHSVQLKIRLRTLRFTLSLPCATVLFAVIKHRDKFTDFATQRGQRKWNSNNTMQACSLLGGGGDDDDEGYCYDKDDEDDNLRK